MSFGEEATLQFQAKDLASRNVQLISRYHLRKA
jgi:hypothetical protein